LLYTILKIPAQIAFYFYCRHLSVNSHSILKTEGPLLIAANHPNSFLDAIIVATLFKRPIYSLARGDAFTNRFVTFLLRSMKIMPVYRISEGAENLNENYSTFDKCKEIFKKNGIVLIFSEGLCLNEWHLRSLKKGTARLALDSWNQGIPLKILPLGINYHSFNSFGKNIILRFGSMITRKDIDTENIQGKSISSFNNTLKNKLQSLVIEIPINDNKKIKDNFYFPISKTVRILLSLPALAGFVIHAPLYIPIKFFIYKKTSHTVHYDSIMACALFLMYPIYLMAISLILFSLTCSWWCYSLVLVLPFFAWSYLQLKKQF